MSTTTNSQLESKPNWPELHDSQSPQIGRRKSSSDISIGRSHQESAEPVSEASTTRTNRTDSLTSDRTSAPEVSDDENGNKQENSFVNDSISDQPSESSKEKSPGTFVGIAIDRIQYKSFFKKILRRKSNSFESYFLPSSSKTKKKDNLKNEVNEKPKNISLINKLKNIFRNLRKSERFCWINTQVISTTKADTVTLVNQPSLKKQLLSPGRKSTAIKLSDLKLARPVKSSNGKLGSFTSQKINRSVASRSSRARVVNTTRVNKTVITRLGSPPPSPAPHDALLEKTEHNLCIINNETERDNVRAENRITTPATKYKEKVNKFNGQSLTNTYFSDTVVNVNSQAIIHIEPRAHSENSFNDCQQTHERYDSNIVQELSYKSKKGSQPHNDTHYLRQTYKAVKIERSRINSDIERFEHIQRYVQEEKLLKECITSQPTAQQNNLPCKLSHQENIPQPSTSREYPQDQQINDDKRVAEQYINHQCGSAQYRPLSYSPPPNSPAHRNQLQYIPPHNDSTNSESEHKQHSREIKRRTLKPYTENFFWRRNCSGNHISLGSTPDIEDINPGIIFSVALSNQPEDKEPYNEYYQKPTTVRQKYTETRGYDYQDHEKFNIFLFSPDLEQNNSNYPECPEASHHNMEAMSGLDDGVRKIIIEFCHLLEKSKQLFNGLRELPQYGHTQWHSYFGRTFDVYTKLWKFQQQHRAILDNKYGLKRWQIGEIASKIGQLYYHFYLRTSETAYLYEAYSFYFAIRGRSYYTKACKEDKCELMVKKLRYYARFIVVCLLLKKIKLVRDLIKELDKQIIEYGNIYDPDDQVEWTVVMDEVKAFIQAEPVLTVIHPDNYPLTLSHRLSSLSTPPVERSPLMTLSLQDVIIVGSGSHQIKSSEMTIDMFRMLQTLEREPSGEIQQMYDESPRQRFNLTPTAFPNKGYNLDANAPHCENPHKYLLFKPTSNQILVYLSSSINDLPPNGALLVYMSAEGQIGTPSKHVEDGYDIGGLITTSKNEMHRDSTKEQKVAQSKYRDVNSFHPGDLFPFTRRPLFVIIDSDNSYVFQSMPRHFGQPLVILMSPLELPPSLNVLTSDRRQTGNLFTLFLHSPLKAFCHCCDIHTLSVVTWDKAQTFIDSFLAEASLIVTRSRIDSQYISFMGDDFLRVLILRFVFCELVLRVHRAFKTRSQRARSSPPIPDGVLEHPTLIRIVLDLASHLQVRAHFQESPSTMAPQNNE